MKSFTIFFNFFGLSFKEFSLHKKDYFQSCVALFCINLITSIPWQGMGYESNGIYEIIANIVAALLSLVVIVNIVMIEKGKTKDRPKEGLLYTIPTYLIYTLYCMIIISMGLFLYIVPGILAYLVLLMVPLSSVLIDNDSVNYFKVSFQMFKKEPLLIFILALATIMSEGIFFLFDLIPDWQVAMAIEVLYGFIDAVLITLVTMTSVKIFYHIKKLLMIKAE